VGAAAVPGVTTEPGESGPYRALRDAGAVIAAVANMHELGSSSTGNTSVYGAAHNPWDVERCPGGSSSGPAASAAAGLCPAAVGADGGGSIRIPSAFCGLVGIKGTFGRTSSYGSTPLTWSNDQLGPLTGNAVDAARMYAVMAGPDPNDPNTLGQPAPSLMDVGRADLDGITLGVYWPWFEHVSAEIVAACKEMLNALQGRGATVKEVTIPDLDTARIGHLVSITSEMLNAQAKYDREHFKEYSLEVQTNLTLAKAFTAPDYLQALKARTEAMAHFREALTWVDVIVTPTTGVTAPIIPSDALPDGESDLTTLLAIMRFATPANFTGLPAISFPAGYDAGGLPIGFQAMGRPWEEHVLLRLALMAETLVPKIKPKVFYDLLGQAG
jgi:Asp-tRNA(Asn)/Glu-tRNA(Gln) amidotransferase A subunit family amidase